MIPEEFKQEVIGNGLAFMKTITDAYGTEEGLKLWETIADTLDPDLKGEIFFAMLSGEYAGQISINSVMPESQRNKIGAIKAIRAWSLERLGLKEAKDAVELVEYQNKPFKFKVESKQRHLAIKELRDCGYFCS